MGSGFEWWGSVEMEEGLGGVLSWWLVELETGGVVL